MTNIESFNEKHKEYSVLTMYPPFSISLKKSRDFKNDINQEEDRVLTAQSSEGDEAFARVYSTLEVKWQDDIDEARLYQKRYGNKWMDAKKAALELNNLSADDDDVPLD